MYWGGGNDLSVTMHNCTPLEPNFVRFGLAPHFYLDIAVGRKTEWFTKWEVNGEPREHAFRKFMGCNRYRALGRLVLEQNRCK